MTDRNIGMEILDGIKEIKKHNKGEITLKTTTLANPSPAQTIRKKLSAFSGFFCRFNGR